MSDLVSEICVESVAAARAAEEAGADRVELCAGLLEGGTTPSAGTIAVARRGLRLGLMVMIRPRGGDFCYDAAEFDAMRRDVEIAKEHGADGVVLGILRPDGTVDAERTQALVDLARPLSVTFHRAFDMARDLDEALETIVESGARRILTSGGEASALEGLERIRRLVEQAGDRIVILPGGGITERNVARIVAGTGAREIHFACRALAEGPMRHRNPHCFMGGELRPPEYDRWTTTAQGIRAVLDAARAAPGSNVARKELRT